MERIIYSSLFLLITLLLETSCNKFLEEKPSKSTSLVVTTTDELDALLNNFENFYVESNPTAVYSTDDNGFSMQLYNSKRSAFNMSIVEHSLWDIEYLENQRDVASLWSNEYKKIFHANMVLENLGRVTGAPQQKETLKADAHFIRAYSYWLLANTYCLPYTETNKNAQGLPFKMSTSFEESAIRAPLYKIYELIEADLQEALKTSVSLVQNGVSRSWRASKEGVNSFAARYYLNRNNYVKALQHAEMALSSYNRLVDYNTKMKYGKDQVVTVNPGTSAQQVTIKYPYTHDNQSDMTDRLGWDEFLYFRVLSNANWWFIPSSQLLALYDTQHDLRYTYHMVEHYSYDRGFISPAYDYPGYVFFFKSEIPSGPTVAEMHLIKAECIARVGDVSAAMTILNQLRSKRMLVGEWVNLTAIDKKDAVKQILEERRREMPFSQRWYDIRRLNNNEDPNDDIDVLEKLFYPYNGTTVFIDQPSKVYSLPKGSNRFASPLPKNEIILGKGEIVQNRY